MEVLAPFRHALHKACYEISPYRNKIYGTLCSISRKRRDTENGEMYAEYAWFLYLDRKIFLPSRLVYYTKHLYKLKVKFTIEQATKSQRGVEV